MQASITGKARTEWRQMETSCEVVCLCQRLIIYGQLSRGHQSILVENASAGLHFNYGWDPEVVLNTLKYLNPFSLLHFLDSDSSYRPRALGEISQTLSTSHSCQRLLVFNAWHTHSAVLVPSIVACFT